MGSLAVMRREKGEKASDVKITPAAHTMLQLMNIVQSQVHLP